MVLLDYHPDLSFSIFITYILFSLPNPTNFVLYNDFSSYSFFSWAFIGKCHFEKGLGDATELKQ